MSAKDQCTQGNPSTSSILAKYRGVSLRNGLKVEGGVPVYQWNGEPVRDGTKVWVTTITVQGRLTYLGAYEVKEEAARQYDKASIVLFGQSAVTNFPKSDYHDEDFDEVRVKVGLATKVAVDAGTGTSGKRRSEGAVRQKPAQKRIKLSSEAQIPYQASNHQYQPPKQCHKELHRKPAHEPVTHALTEPLQPSHTHASQVEQRSERLSAVEMPLLCTSAEPQASSGVNPHGPISHPTQVRKPGQHVSKTRGSKTSAFQGVSLDRATGLWRVQMFHEKRNVSGGKYFTELEAARAYDVLARQMKSFKDAAKLVNFPTDKELLAREQAQQQYLHVRRLRPVWEEEESEDDEKEVQVEAQVDEHEREKEWQLTWQLRQEAYRRQHHRQKQAQTQVQNVPPHQQKQQQPCLAQSQGILHQVLQPKAGGGQQEMVQADATSTMVRSRPKGAEDASTSSDEWVQVQVGQRQGDPMEVLEMKAVEREKHLEAPAPQATRPQAPPPLRSKPSAPEPEAIQNRSLALATNSVKDFSSSPALNANDRLKASHAGGKHTRMKASSSGIANFSRTAVLRQGPAGSYLSGGVHKAKGKGKNFRGVSLYKATGKWMVQFRHEGRNVFGGYFKCELEAAHAYDAQIRALKHPSDVARMANFPDELPPQELPNHQQQETQQKQQKSLPRSPPVRQQQQQQQPHGKQGQGQKQPRLDTLASPNGTQQVAAWALLSISSSAIHEGTGVMKETGGAGEGSGVCDEDGGHEGAVRCEGQLVTTRQGTGDKEEAWRRGEQENRLREKAQDVCGEMGGKGERADSKGGAVPMRQWHTHVLAGHNPGRGSALYADNNPSSSTAVQACNKPSGSMLVHVGSKPGSKSVQPRKFYHLSQPALAMAPGDTTASKGARPIASSLGDMETSKQPSSETAAASSSSGSMPASSLPQAGRLAATADAVATRVGAAVSSTSLHPAPPPVTTMPRTVPELTLQPATSMHLAQPKPPTRLLSTSQSPPPALPPPRTLSPLPPAPARVSSPTPCPPSNPPAPASRPASAAAAAEPMPAATGRPRLQLSSALRQYDSGPASPPVPTGLEPRPGLSPEEWAYVLREIAGSQAAAANLPCLPPPPAAPGEKEEAAGVPPLCNLKGVFGGNVGYQGGGVGMGEQQGSEQQMQAVM